MNIAAIYKALNIEENEKGRVQLLLLQSVFLGIFYGTFDIGASALFLDAFPADKLPVAFTVSGIVGIILTALYSSLQSRISFGKLSFLNLFSIAVMSGLLWVGYIVSNSPTLAFIVLVMMGPLNILAIVGFWGVAGRLFSLREGKRLFGLVDAGQIIGVIISSFAIPILLSSFFRTQELLLLCAFSVAIAGVIQLTISKKYNLSAKTKNNRTKENSEASPPVKKEGFFAFLKNKYVRFMSLSVTLSMITAFFVHYSFLAVSDDKYPESIELAKFLGVYTGLLMTFSLIIKTFIYSKLMKTYNLVTNLLILPVLLFILTILASFAGSIWGYTSDVPTFTFFFLLLALSRLFSRSLRESIELPAFKIFYQSLSSDKRHDIQAKIDGVVNEFSALFSGALLALPGMLSWFSLLHYTYTLAIILPFWIWVIYNLYAMYKNSLKETLNKSINIKKKNTNNETTETYSNQYLQFLKNYNNIEYINLILKNPKLYPNKSLFNEYKLNDKGFPIYSSSSQKTNSGEIEKYAKSSNSEERAKAAYLISQNNNLDDKSIQILLILLRDFNRSVRLNAIKAIYLHPTPNAIQGLLDCLSDPITAPAAEQTILRIGNEALSPLEQYFYSSGISNTLKLKTVNIIGNIGTPTCHEMLEGKLILSDYNIIKEAINGLQKSNYTANNETGIRHIRQAIEFVIQIIITHKSYIENLKKVPESEHIINVFKENIQENFNYLYKLLKLEYEPQSVEMVKRNLELGSNESIGYALELLDIFIAEEMKPILLALFENTTDIEKLNYYAEYFPIDNYEPREILEHIISGSINTIPAQIINETILLYSKLFLKKKIPDCISAHIFNNNVVIRETAAYVIYKNNFEFYSIITKRLDKKTKQSIDSVILKLIRYSNKLKINIINNIMQVLSTRNFNLISDLVAASNEYNLNSPTILKTDDYYFIYSYNEKIRFKRNESEIIQNNVILNLKSGEIIPKEKQSIYYVSKAAFYSILFKYPELKDLIKKL